MSASTMTPDLPRSAREMMVAGEQQAGFADPGINFNAPRYFAQLGWASLHVDTPAVTRGVIWRGDIAVCRNARVREHHACIPETQKIPGSNEEGHDGKLAWAYYLKFAWHEAERLLKAEDEADRKNGLIEITALYSDLGNRIYKMIDLTRLFFPTWPKLPDLNMDLLAELSKRVEWIEDNPPSELPDNQVNLVLPVLIDAGNELIAGIEKIDRLQRQELTRTHMSLKLKRGDDNWKERYDDRDHEILKRTGLPQLDQHEITQATALQKLTDKSIDSGAQVEALLKQNADLMQQMALQSAQNSQMLQLLMAQQGIKAPEPAAAEEKPNTPKIPNIPKNGK